MTRALSTLRRQSTDASTATAATTATSTTTATGTHHVRRWRSVHYNSISAEMLATYMEGHDVFVFTACGNFSNYSNLIFTIEAVFVQRCSSHSSTMDSPNEPPFVLCRAIVLDHVTILTSPSFALCSLSSPSIVIATLPNINSIFAIKRSYLLRVAIFLKKGRKIERLQLR